MTSTTLPVAADRTSRRREARGQPTVDRQLLVIPFVAPSKKALELTFRQALRLGDASVGTHHVLLALVELENGSGPLTSLGVDRAGVEAVLAELGRKARRKGRG
jgi:Clp amino terminal domain, pathogenicity island component